MKNGKFLATIAGICVGYFGISSFFWILYFFGSFYNDPSVRQDLPAHQQLIALPCFLLTTLFAVAAWQVLRRRNTAKFIIVIGIILAALLFWYDTSHSRYQARFYSKNGNYVVYVTWWWFNGSSK